jgi:hypothetical protein
VLVPDKNIPVKLKMAAMREIDSRKGMAEVARMYQPRVESETAYGQTTGEIKTDMGGRKDQSGEF